MTKQLDGLRSELNRLRNTRQMVRGISGLAVLLQSTLLILAGGFLLDWLLDMSPAQRFILLTLMGVAMVWCYRRLVRPWFGQDDDLIELALNVEQKHGIDNDLVSALQFESPQARNWGSVQLESAVITQVAELTPQLDVFEGTSFADFKRRLITLAVATSVLVLVSGLFPDYFHAYLNRLLLGNNQYPTATKIVEVVINGQSVIHASGAMTTEVSSPYGHPVDFTVRTAGETPEVSTCRVHVQSLDGNVSTDVRLSGDASFDTPKTSTAGEGEPGSGDDASGRSAMMEASSEDIVQMFQGELPRLMDSVTIQVLAGDARSIPVTIVATPLPIVEPELTVTPPTYVRAVLSPEDTSESQRMLSVVEGSRVDLTVRSLNKPLQMVELTIGDSEYRLTPSDSEKLEWTLDVRGTAFAGISESIRYQIQARDQEGLELESAIHGMIRLRTDQAPRLAISARTRRVVPTASPPITWSASDDFGLSRVVARIQVARSEGDVSETEVEVAAPSAGSVPQTSLRGTYPLDLSSFKLVKGDELKVTFAAYDYRGDAEPAISYSEPIQLQLTDRQGILSGLLETDEESARQLDAIIRRELGIGDSQ